MATLREAVSQLDTAIKHLEQALESGGDTDDAEGARWRAALDDAKRRNDELTTVTDQVAQRLDRAVSRVTAILES
jgi:prefoldin subunit 5